jgi:hypothetical protein
MRLSVLLLAVWSNCNFDGDLFSKNYCVKRRSQMESGSLGLTDDGTGDHGFELPI